jgi:hypothetical protein
MLDVIGDITCQKDCFLLVETSIHVVRWADHLRDNNL